MVCKEDLCTWFKNLSPHKRIDYMCGMLQMCLPMELRFIGSYVEDLARKDFHQLRESEGKANNRHELSKFNETDGRVFRTKMAVYLALMHSSNRTCSNIIFRLLEKHVREALTVIDTMDVITVHNILLVLSMAMNHPAFTFHQKSRMYEYYREANEAAERILNKTLPEQELLILSESCDMRSCDQRLSPMCSPRVPQMHLLPSPVAPLSSQYIHSPATQDKVYVCEINVKSSRQRDKEKNTIEYIIQVTWSNGEKKNVFKTYQELVEFHKKLVKTFEKDILSHQEAFKLPSLKGMQNHRKENRELLSQYASSLSDLPEHIQQSNFFTSFFENTIQRPVKMTDACTSPRPSVLADVPVVQRLPNSGDEDRDRPPYLGKPRSKLIHLISSIPSKGDMNKKPGQYRGNVRVKGHSAPNSARSARPERMIDSKQDTYSNNGTPPLPTEKSDSNVNNAGSNGSSGYTSDPTSTRPLMRTYKAQPAHTNNIQSHSKVINMPENNFKGGAQPFVQIMAPQHLRDMTLNSTSGHPGYTMSPADIGHRSMIYFPQGTSSCLARSHFNPVMWAGFPAHFPSCTAVNQSIFLLNLQLLMGMPRGKSPNVLLNSVDNQVQTSDTSTHRCPATQTVVSSASSSNSTATYTSSGQTVTTNRPASCSNCGCPGHREGSIPNNIFLPPMQTNMWPTPYPNGLVPMHMQMPHLYHHHMPYHPNGLNQELYNPTVYGMSHSNSQGMAGISNVIYNSFNNHQPSSGGYNQKKPRKINCHNCGSSKHTAGDCPEVSMEAMSGHPIYSYKPKNESD
ncbi:zinc finger CCHC domain-containing protein 2-like [Mercenaria mercenaria]|uniref:zinc finger CCHC domain-containing protein 2-like n=1 Tax=Mercenaria mercenaria TaxID=6596 RepID=UPI00234F95BE|nr:zinc finger CCHC domain-containing protein 2-like [Mercenaria mercenaria]